MKKIFKILIILIVVLIIGILIMKNIINKNQKYLDNKLNLIKENYQLQEETTYFNIYGNYYILTTDTNIIVLNKEYEEVLKEDINILASNKNKYALIYKNNKLMYEETIINKDKLTYKYYDTTNNELIKETEMKEKAR